MNAIMASTRTIHTPRDKSRTIEAKRARIDRKKARAQKYGQGSK